MRSALSNLLNLCLNRENDECSCMTVTVYMNETCWVMRSALSNLLNLCLNRENDECSCMTVTVYVNETCRSLGDVMRDLDAKAVLRGDFILVSGNIVANLNLLPILQYHRYV